MKLVFFGTPEFAVPTLAALVEAGYRPALAVTQPPRPVGRGRKLRHPPVAEWARAHGLEVRQPETVRRSDFMAELRSLAPDLAVVVAFGQIFRRELLELPRLGSINLHASLLPRYRGAAPIQAAIAAGDTETGVVTMLMDVGMDTGPTLLERRLAIGPHETAAELAPRLAEAGAALMVETVRRLERGELEPRPQDDALATYAPRLTKADAVVDWRREATEIYHRLRAYTPWPGLLSELRGEPLKILAARVLEPAELPTGPEPGGLEGPPAVGEPGVVMGLVGQDLAVRAGNGTILGLARVQRPGRKGVSAADYANGQRLRAGERFRQHAGL